MTDGIKVLLGGVPFGENNMGDEAILQCVVGIVRSVCPHADIVVSTQDRTATEKKLDVRSVPLFGFERPYSRAAMREALADADLFVWSGATGLSDYPDNALELVETAHHVGTATVLWGVGMNRRLNPALYTVLPGRRRRVLDGLSRLTGGRVDAVALQEGRWNRRVEKRIRDALSRCHLVVTRDEPSRDRLRDCAVDREIVVGADSAIEVKSSRLEDIELPQAVRELLGSAHRKVGVCVSAQREIEDIEGLVRVLDALVEEAEARVLFIPMNPTTDADLMVDLRRRMRHAAHTAVLSGRYDPADITAVTGRMDLVISSRLHLLILASVSHVPLIGIARGSKVGHFLEPYGLKPAGSVEQCDFGALREEARRLLADRQSFEARSRQVRAEQLRRLETAKNHLAEVVASVGRAGTSRDGASVMRIDG